MREIIIKNENETRAFGILLAKRLKAGDVVALCGDLGTGKTTLTKTIAEGLGVKQELTSPTFTIIKEYDDGRLPLYHFDVYRISDPAEMFELGYEEYFYGKGVSIVEWADKIDALLPEDAIWVCISYGRSESERIYETNIAGENITGENIRCTF